MPQRRPLGADVPDPRSDDGCCLTWKVSVRARGRARRLLPTRPPALAPSRRSQDLPARGSGQGGRETGTGASLPLLHPHRLAAASAFLPRLVFLPALACLLPSPRQAHKFHPPFAFPCDYSPPVSPTCRARPLPTLAFLDLGPPAPNLSATPSPPGRPPGGFPAPARLARCSAPPTPLGARLLQPSGLSVPLSSPNSRFLAHSLSSHVPSACTVLYLPSEPRAPCRSCPPPSPVRPSPLTAYPHAPPLPVLQPQASPAALLRCRFLLSLPGVEEELRHPPTRPPFGGTSVPARRWGCSGLSPFPPREARG